MLANGSNVYDCHDRLSIIMFPPKEQLTSDQVLKGSHQLLLFFINPWANQTFVIISHHFTQWGHSQQTPLHRNPEWLCWSRDMYAAAKGEWLPDKNSSTAHELYGSLVEPRQQRHRKRSIPCLQLWVKTIKALNDKRDHMTMVSFLSVVTLNCRTISVNCTSTFWETSSIQVITYLPKQQWFFPDHAKHLQIVSTSIIVDSQRTRPHHGWPP